MIRQSLNLLLDKKKAEKEIFDGLLSILLHDTESEDSIQRFCTELELDGTFIINLIDLLSANTQRFAQILIDLLKTNPVRDQHKLCQSYISLFKKDLSSVKLIAEKIGIPLT